MLSLQILGLHGMLHRPSHFDPNKKYPLLVSVYAGPHTNGTRETFTLPNPLTEYGFLVASLDSRSAAGRGKRFLDAIYGKLGVTEIELDDDFFELGGNSMTAVELMSRIRETFGVELNIGLLFDAPTLRQLTALLQDQNAG